ncbi:carbonic anhydrase [Auraticoccus sp. F435]|uniref:carbonic anhydrase n=1 Tax=Auraticoccus cholistanensis TaxID=2656650 RepID=A0A6A9UWW1_9ACTN|nr:carbonic anhydrase [Auraticoccus cholistanensis]MVA75717.1 carbonic anhydrase [Auraticoccus cholistanensis]
MDDSTTTGDFADLLEANRRYAATADVAGFDGIARAGVAMVTCMDSRIDPLAMLGLSHGDAKILRTPGGHVTPDTVVGCVLGVHLLGVQRIMVVPHTRCAMASGTDEEILDRVRQASGLEPEGFVPGADPDQLGRLRADLQLLREHPLLAGRATVAGFLYDVDSGLLTEVA